jgi:hypothetical protein
MLSFLWMTLAEPALAADPATPAVKEEKKPEIPEEQKTHYEISFRGRMMSVPDSIMNIWFFTEKDPAHYGAGLPPRSKLKGYAVGLEFVVKGDSANGIFYFDYGASLMKPGYFDDKEEPDDHLDGDYVVPTKNFGFVALGADVAPEVHIVRTSKTNGAFGLSLLPGGGLGLGIVTGRLDAWLPCDAPSANPQNYPVDRYPDGCGGVGTTSDVVYASGIEAVKDKVPFDVFPMVDINVALRFNFGNRAVLRVEGGLHTLIYYGATLGIMF